MVAAGIGRALPRWVSDRRFQYAPEVMGIIVEGLLVVILLLTFGIIRC